MVYMLTDHRSLIFAEQSDVPVFLLLALFLCFLLLPSAQRIDIVFIVAADLGERR